MPARMVIGEITITTAHRQMDEEIALEAFFHALPRQSRGPDRGRRTHAQMAG